jgi:hypothetical protein
VSLLLSADAPSAGETKFFTSGGGVPPSPGSGGSLMHDHNLAPQISAVTARRIILFMASPSLAIWFKQNRDAKLDCFKLC